MYRKIHSTLSTAADIRVRKCTTEPILDGFIEGFLLSVVATLILAVWFLARGLPDMVMGIIEEYFPVAKRNGKSRPVEGLANLTQNPLIGTVISALRSAPPASEMSSPAKPGLLGGLLRR